MEQTILPALPLLVKEGYLDEADQKKITDSLAAGKTLDGLFLKGFSGVLKAWVSRSEPLTLAPSTLATAGSNPFGDAPVKQHFFTGAGVTGATTTAPSLQSTSSLFGPPSDNTAASPFGVPKSLPAGFFSPYAATPEALAAESATKTTATPASTKKQFKILLVGSGGVGKTQLLNTLQGKPFDVKYAPTVGVDVQSYTSPKHDVVINFWDIAGQEKFGGLREGYFIMADAAILVYDTSSAITLREMRMWARDVKRATNDHIPMVVVANKREEQTEKDGIEEGTKPYPTFTASAKNGPTMQAAVDHLLSVLLGQTK